MTAQLGQVLLTSYFFPFLACGSDCRFDHFLIYPGNKENKNLYTELVKFVCIKIYQIYIILIYKKKQTNKINLSHIP